MIHDSRIKGFTLIEVLVGAAVFVTVAVAVYGAYAGVFQLAALNQARILATNLADEQFEIIRNMPYGQIGIVSGIPSGVLPATTTISRGGISFDLTYTIRDIDLPFDGTFASTTNNDTAPSDNKFVQISVSCPTCKGFIPIVVSGQVAPKNLENTSNNGALFIQAIDANGNPVQGASVHVAYTATSSPVIIDDTTNNSGILGIVNIPPASQAYAISVTKAGYSSDQTYVASSSNPNPSKPKATVAAQQMTSVSFAIDRTSNLSISSVTPTCVAVPNMDFNLVGTKLIGPGVPKYSKAQSTGVSGTLNIGSAEWDSYSIAPTDSAYDLAGINPLNPIALSPNSSQSIQLIVVPKTSNSLMITVKDSATKLPVSNATVELTGSSSYDQTQTTGQGYIDQADWSGGSGQSDYSAASRYFADDSNVDVMTSAGNVALKKVFGSYSPNGILESSTFNTGTTSNFYTLSWNPGSQPVAAGANSVRLQFATSPTSAPSSWDFFGPDGTAATYYTSPGMSISSANNSNQFARYRAYLSTASTTVTPNVSDIYFTYTSGCVPPGQVIFTGLSTGTYSVSVSKAGYTTYGGSFTVNGGWQEQQVLIGP